MNAQSVTLKPGVLFLETPSGGVLMDIDADRFLALSHLSATMWRSLASGQTPEGVIHEISVARGMPRDSAEALLIKQLRTWERTQLINTRELPIVVPQPKASSPIASCEFSVHAIRSAPLVPSLMASLHLAELKYRRALIKVGLARTLKSFQVEPGCLARPREAVIQRTLRNYNALRRAFRQGKGARDCLVRSLALAAVLRRQGVAADLCIGIVDLPFLSHAWVEADGQLLNETLPVCERYSVIGRF